jgi:hypothetical protein
VVALHQTSQNNCKIANVADDVSSPLLLLKCVGRDKDDRDAKTDCGNHNKSHGKEGRRRAILLIERQQAIQVIIGHIGGALAQRHPAVVRDFGLCDIINLPSGLLDTEHTSTSSNANV